jgi:tRNA A-37 threonylcarbamoyl transferase component Bud32/anti-sigma factor RsiW
MNASPAAHPDAERLRAYGLGQLDADQASAIEVHVAACQTCCESLVTVPDDQLVSLLRSAVSSATEPDADARSTLPPSEKQAEAFREQATLVHPAKSTSDLEVPPELAEHPRYRIVELLGVGGMGVVYKAEHRLMERSVALKVIDRSLTNKPAMVERFRREVKAAGQLNHPNIVHSYDAEQVGDMHYLVMEFVAGTTLARVVEHEGPLPIERACDYVRQAALGLQKAAENGMVHRDIKPQNLMLTPNGQVKILDFGLARVASETVPSLAEGDLRQLAADEKSRESLTQIGSVMGTPDYMAPEQITNAHAADIRADIYSLGCTLYFLLTGRVPFPTKGVFDKLMAHTEQQPTPLAKWRPEVPIELARVVEKMMAKNPEKRYATPAEVAEALEPFTGSKKPARRRLWLIAAAAALFAVLILGGVMIYVQTDKGEFVIDAADDSVAVAAKGQTLKIIDQDSKREYQVKLGAQDMRSGKYKLVATELPGDKEISSDKETFDIVRGGKTRVTVSFRSKGSNNAVIKKFNPVDAKPIARDGVTAAESGWKIEAKEQRENIPLFEVKDPGVDDCTVLYKAKIKSADVKGRAYLVMWCRFPEGEAFSKGFGNAIRGTTDWAEYQIPFYLKKGEKPDLIKLQFTFEGSGTVWIKDIELVRAPLPPQGK